MFLVILNFKSNSQQHGGSLQNEARQLPETKEKKVTNN